MLEAFTFNGSCSRVSCGFVVVQEAEHFFVLPVYVQAVPTGASAFVVLVVVLREGDVDYIS